MGFLHSVVVNQVSLQWPKHSVLNSCIVRKQHSKTFGGTRVWSAALLAVGSRLPENDAYFNTTQKKHCSDISTVVVITYYYDGIFLSQSDLKVTSAVNRKVFWCRPWFSLLHKLIYNSNKGPLHAKQRLCQSWSHAMLWIRLNFKAVFFPFHSCNCSIVGSPFHGSLWNC